jgi:flagellin-like protein
MINKRGISGIVATVSVIAIAIVLGTLAGYLILSPIKLKLGPEISCTQLELQSPFTINSACYDAQNSEIKVSLSRPLTGAEVTEFGFSLSSATEAQYNVQCGNICDSCTLLQKGETKFYRLPADSDTTQLVLSVQGCTLVSRSIAPCAA